MNQEEMATGDVQDHSAQPKRSQRKSQTHTVDSEHVSQDVKLEPEKKSRKTPIILGIILAILLLIGAGFFAWYFFYYSNPEKVMADAADDLISAENLALAGTVAFTPDASANSALQQIEIDFNSAMNQAPASSTQAVIKFIFENDELILEVGSVQLKDGVAYIRVSGILDALEKAGVAEALSEEAQIVFDALEIIDDEWWEISITDLIDEFELADNDTQRLKAMYDCAYTAINNNYREEFTQLYRAHSFVQLEKVKTLNFPHETNYQGLAANTGSTYYQVNFDYAQMTEFINSIPESPLAEELYVCVNDNIPSSNLDAKDFDEVNLDDVKAAFPEDTHIYFEISNWRHQLKTVVMQLADGDVVVNLGLHVRQNQQVAVTVPDSYRPITELADEIIEMTVNLLYIQQMNEINMIEQPWNN